MKYALQMDLYMVSENAREYRKWHYLAVDSVSKAFHFETKITKETKLFDSAREAGEYLDKYWANKSRYQFKSIKIVEVER